MNLNINKRIRTKFVQFDNKGNLYCYNCHNYFPINDFDINNNNWFRSNKDRRCKECKNKQYKKRLLNNNDSNNIEKLLLKRYLGLIERAKRKGFIVNVDLNYIINLWYEQEGKCALSNIDMTFISNKGRIPTNVSIDRIDNAKGYIRGNIQLVCMSINQMKNDLDENYLVYLCKEIIKKYESKS